MKSLEDIGFYTLTDRRAQTASSSTPLQRCEILITDRCNFHCPYCRGVSPLLKGDLSPSEVRKVIALWVREGLQNIRFTGGEPTLYDHEDLLSFVDDCAQGKVKHIAISTNGTADTSYYDSLIEHGVNDFSISLDGGCCNIGDIMSGGAVGYWNRVVENIRFIASRTYVTLGMVFTEDNIGECTEAVLFADSLHVGDIRVIPSAQYNRALVELSSLPDSVLRKYSILQYRIENIRAGKLVRGLGKTDYHKCPLVLDDMAVAAGWHFPCVIYMREQGNPIGRLSENTRRDRELWFQSHNTFEDSICRTNCLDVCVDYNNKWRDFHENHPR